MNGSWSCWYVCVTSSLVWQRAHTGPKASRMFVAVDRGRGKTAIRSPSWRDLESALTFADKRAALEPSYRYDRMLSASMPRTGRAPLQAMEPSRPLSPYASPWLLELVAIVCCAEKNTMSCNSASLRTAALLSELTQLKCWHEGVVIPICKTGELVRTNSRLRNETIHCDEIINSHTPSLNRNKVYQGTS